MAGTALTLAALATSAVEGLDVVRVRSHSAGGDGDYASAVLDARDGREVIVRVPRSEAAATEQGTDLVALAALTAGIRSRLPFDVPTALGQTPFRNTRAVAYDFLPGTPLAAETVVAGTDLPASVGRAIAAVHGLPTGFVAEAGLPVLSAAECHASTATLIDSAQATGLLPAALRTRWRDATGDASVWQFTPSVVNGSLGAESILAEGESVTAIIGWAGMRVGDPARDLHWLLGLPAGASDEALAAYARSRQMAADRRFTQRALLYAELEIARWLLHGRQVRDDAIVEDAVQMLDELVDRVHDRTAAPLGTDTGPILAVGDVESMLTATPGDRASGDYGHDGGMRPVDDDDDRDAGDDEWQDDAGAPEDTEASDDAASDLPAAPEDPDRTRDGSLPGAARDADDAAMTGGAPDGTVGGGDGGGREGGTRRWSAARRSDDRAGERQGRDIGGLGAFDGPSAGDRLTDRGARPGWSGSGR